LGATDQQTIDQLPVLLLELVQLRARLFRGMIFIGAFSRRLMHAFMRHSGHSATLAQHLSRIPSKTHDA
jgi:hypothetical protein